MPAEVEKVSDIESLNETGTEKFSGYVEGYIPEYAGEEKISSYRKPKEKFRKIQADRKILNDL